MFDDSRKIELTHVQEDLKQNQPDGFSASRKFFENVLHWLGGLIRMTDEEQKVAGIYLGDQNSPIQPGPAEFHFYDFNWPDESGRLSLAEGLADE